MYQYYFFKLWKVLGAIGLALILWASINTLVTPNIKVPYLDKILHFNVYLIACYYFCQVFQNKSLKKIIVNIVLFSAFIELLQSFTNERYGEFADLLANFLGASTGAIISNFTPSLLIPIDKILKKLIS